MTGDSLAEPYNPLSKKNLGDSIAAALLRSDVHPLSKVDHLVGAGIYALYYTGDFKAYKRIRAPNSGRRFRQPIYVGKAVPEGSRKGGATLNAAKGAALRKRLRQHVSSIEAVSNLRLGHFYYRALTVDDIWISLGENALIEKFRPLWNVVIDGFGNNVTGKGRPDQKRSAWDAIHPGRLWTIKLKLHPRNQREILAEIAKHLDRRPMDPDKSVSIP